MCNEQRPNQPLQAKHNCQAILLVGDPDFIMHAVGMLCDRNYLLYTATDITTACTILQNRRIDLTIYANATVNMAYGGWQAYTRLRQATTRPILAIKDSGTNKAELPEGTQPGQQAQFDLHKYMALFELLLPAFR